MTKFESLRSGCGIRRVGHGPKHHFFGYYNKTNWDRSGRYLLAQRVDDFTADKTPGRVAKLGYFDLLDGDRFHEVGATTAWNWQMGSQLQWLEGSAAPKILYNARADAFPELAGSQSRPYPEFCCVVHNIQSGEDRVLGLPAYVVAPNSRYALTLDYSRFQHSHPTIGYQTKNGEPPLEPAPANDGIHHLDLESGESHLILSLDRLTRFHPVASMENAFHWVSHMEINPSSSRFLLLHRWTRRIEDETCWLHRLITANPDGTELCLLEDGDHPIPQLEDSFDSAAVGTFDYEKSEYQISHPLWKNDREIIVWGPHAGAIHYHLYRDRTDSVEVIGKDVLTENGHMSYSKDGRWILTDTYPDSETNERLLILYDTWDDQRHDIGSFYTDPALGKENRCDLHPRWSPDDRTVCIDSVHEQVRQLYLIDVSPIVGTKESQPAIQAAAGHHPST